MSGAISSGGGAGIHPGAPIIWPESKPEAEAVQRSQTSAQTGQVKSSQTAQTAPSSSTAETQQAAQQIQQQQAQISRRLNMQDLMSQLLQANMRPTEANKQTALQMLQYGLELSPENFAKLNKLTQGDQGQSTTAAMLTILKGLDNNSATVPLLAKFLQQNQQVAQQNQATQASLQNLISTLQSSKGMLPPILAGQLITVAGKYEEMFKKLPTSKENLAELLSKEGNISDLKGFRALLQGTMKQLQQTADNGSQQVQNTMRQLAEAEKELGELMNSITAQAVLSKSNINMDPSLPEKYFYWLIPNFITRPPSDLELLIQKDGKSKKDLIDANKTTIIMKLQTEDLGQITIEMKVAQRKIDFRFNTEDDATGKLINANLKDIKERMEVQDFRLNTFQVQKKTVDFKKYLVPLLDLDDMTRVRTQV
ncbi:MAG: flagellar hook-length control protein FliK [Candidatus Margulisiibacteriota bacterium]|jgi:hypothetical protein